MKKAMGVLVILVFILASFADSSFGGSKKKKRQKLKQRKRIAAAVVVGHKRGAPTGAAAKKMTNAECVKKMYAANPNAKRKDIDKVCAQYK